MSENKPSIFPVHFTDRYTTFHKRNCTPPFRPYHSLSLVLIRSLRINPKSQPELYKYKQFAACLQKIYTSTRIAIDFPSTFMSINGPKTQNQTKSKRVYVPSPLTDPSIDMSLALSESSVLESQAAMCLLNSVDNLDA